MTRVRDLADLVGGTVIGDGEVEIRDVAQAGTAGEGEITFAISEKYLEKVRNSAASAVFVAAATPLTIPQIVVNDPRVASLVSARHFHPERSYGSGTDAGAYVHPEAVVDPSARLFDGCYVGSGAKVGARTVLMPGVVLMDDVVVGDDSLLYPNVVVGERCVLGNRVILHAGVSVGADGYGFFQEGGRHFKIPQVGIAVIEDDVEIGANSCVDRAMVGRTVIGEGTKIDNLVQVGHNCVIGKNCLLVSQTGLAGSVRLGDGTLLAAKAGVSDNVEIGAGSIVAGMSGVASDLPEGSRVGGLPAIPQMEWKRNLMHFKRLHHLANEVKRLAERVGELEELCNKLKRE